MEEAPVEFHTAASSPNRVICYELRTATALRSQLSISLSSKILFILNWL